MTRDEFISLLKGGNNTEEDSSPASYFKSSSEKEEEVIKELDSSLHKKKEKEGENPYSQSDLEKFILDAGFSVDEVPKFSEIAKRMDLFNRVDPVVKDLTKLDNHDIIKDISPERKKASKIDKDALNQIISKYKG